MSDLAATIDAAWEDRASLNAQTKGAVRDAVEDALDAARLGQAARRRTRSRPASGT